jgi:hypothetical protein
MKLDKETLIKERFWFLLPVIALFLLISWICILLVRGDTAKYFTEAKSQNDELKRISTTQDLKNPKWIQAMDKELEVSEAKRDDLWYDEFNRQNQAVREKDPRKGPLVRRDNPFITCPERMRQKWEDLHPGKKLSDMDFGGNLGNIPQDEFREQYLGQYAEIVNLVHDWLDESNLAKVTGAVRVAGGSGNHAEAALKYLVQPIGLTNKLILSEEAWLIEEDIAVKRELFQSLADLLDSYAKLKPEWAEVPNTEIKVVAAPAPATPASGTDASMPPVGAPMVAGANGHSNPTAAAGTAQEEAFQRIRFYNYVWPNMLDAQRIAQDDRLRDTLTRLGLPAVESYKGWRLDLARVQDPKDEHKLVLRVVSGNHSDKFKLPAMPIAVWFSEPGNDAKELPQPIILTDAGNVDPCEYWPRGGLKRLSEKKLQDIPIPAGYGKIKRVTRAMPENAVAQQVCFNRDWLVNLRLVQQPNRPSMNLVGDVYNRSGRRLPGAIFTAGMIQANSNTPLKEDFSVATDAFNAGERKSFFREIRFPIPPRGVEFVSQKLTWRSTPIKRIDKLELGALAHSQSDRLKVLPLKTYDFKKKEAVSSAVAGTPAPAEAAPANPQGGGEGAFQAVMPGTSSGGTGAGSSNELRSPNQGIRLDRYTEVTPQLRRIPVALVMTVDATAMDDVIGAMSNSRLRFQVTMAPWTRVQNLGRPGGGGGAAAAAAPAGGSKMGGGASGRSAPPDDAVATGGAGQGRGVSLSQPPKPGGPSSPASGTPSPFGLEDDSSVVELQIFGIITIYESPDAQKKAVGTVAAADTNPSTPK